VSWFGIAEETWFGPSGVGFTPAKVEFVLSPSLDVGGPLLLVLASAKNVAPAM